MFFVLQRILWSPIGNHKLINIAAYQFPICKQMCHCNFQLPLHGLKSIQNTQKNSKYSNSKYSKSKYSNSKFLNLKYLNWKFSNLKYSKSKYLKSKYPEFKNRLKLWYFFAKAEFIKVWQDIKHFWYVLYDYWENYESMDETWFFWPVLLRSWTNSLWSSKILLILPSREELLSTSWHL